MCALRISAVVGFLCVRVCVLHDVHSMNLLIYVIVERNVGVLAVSIVFLQNSTKELFNLYVHKE